MKRSELKGIVSTILLETLNTGGYRSKEFMRGQQQAMKDMLADIKRDLSPYSADFVKGYKQIQREKWWDKFNAKLTDFLGRLGSSRLR